MLDLWISVFHQDFLCVCKRGGTPAPWPGLTVHIGGPEGPDGGGPLPVRSQHLHLQAVEGGGPQTWDRELRVILGKGGKALGDTGPSAAASDRNPRLDSPPETTPPSRYHRDPRSCGSLVSTPPCPGTHNLSMFAGDPLPPRPPWSGQQGDPGSWQPRAHMSQASSCRSPPPPPGDCIFHS